MGKRSLTFYGATALVAGAALPCLMAGGEPITPKTPAPPASVALPPEAPLIAYPSVTPASTLSAHSMNEVRHFKGPNGVPRLPTPNPWFALDLYQGTITRADFEQKLHTLFDPFGAFAPFININDQRVVIYPSATDHSTPQFVLNFAAPGQPAPAGIRWFRTPDEFKAATHPPDKPLDGLRIAIDPGHIGGPWAQMEERSTRYNGSAPVQEGDLNLITARILKKELTDAGASVYVLRDSTEPVTPYRPDDFIEEARELLIAHAKNQANLRALPPDHVNLLLGSRLTELTQFLFYRCSEIIERGNRIRNNFVPDITVTLYIDATPRSARGRVTDVNANIFFVGGSYTKTEMQDAEMQRRAVYKICEGGSAIEAQVAHAISLVFAQRTGLGAVKYGDSSTTRQVLPDDQYVVARNLAANREYDGPVVCTEPYFMNNRIVYQRLLSGDYDGTRNFNGKPYTSIFREYADCVAQGLVKAYSNPTVIAGASNVPPAPANVPPGTPQPKVR